MLDTLALILLRNRVSTMVSTKASREFGTVRNIVRHITHVLVRDGV